MSISHLVLKQIKEWIYKRISKAGSMMQKNTVEKKNKDKNL